MLFAHAERGGHVLVGHLIPPENNKKESGPHDELLHIKGSGHMLKSHLVPMLLHGLYKLLHFNAVLFQLFIFQRSILQWFPYSTGTFTVPILQLLFFNYMRGKLAA
jgi:hypothetical protein